MYTVKDTGPAWWRHQMETFFGLLVLCAGHSPVTGEFHSHTNSSDAEPWCFLIFCTRINGWVNDCEAGDLGCHRAHYDVTVMKCCVCYPHFSFDKQTTSICNGTRSSICHCYRGLMSEFISEKFYSWTQSALISWWRFKRNIILIYTMTVISVLHLKNVAQLSTLNVFKTISFQ